MLFIMIIVYYLKSLQITLPSLENDDKKDNDKTSIKTNAWKWEEDEKDQDDTEIVIAERTKEKPENNYVDVEFEDSRWK